MLAKPAHRPGRWLLPAGLIVLSVGGGTYAWQHFFAADSAPAGQTSVQSPALPPPLPVSAPPQAIPLLPPPSAGPPPALATDSAPDSGDPIPPLPLAAPSGTEPPASVQSVQTPVPVADSAPADGPRAEESERLLAKARQQIAALRLTQPAGDNAYETYQALNRVDADRGLRLLDEIVIQYLDLSRKYLDAGDITRPAGGNAWQTYQKMRELAPDHQAVEVLLEEIRNALAERAETQLQAGRPGGPDGDGAYGAYRALSEIAPQHTRVAQLRERLLSALLEQAERQFQSKKYTTPVDDSAYTTYRQILQLDAENVQAKAGLERLAGNYLKLAKERLAQNNPGSALVLARRGLEILPQHADLLALRREAEQKQRAAAPPAAPQITASAANSAQGLLEQAARQFAEGKLTQPLGDNAQESFQAALRQAPGNPQARQGLLRIAERYAEMAGAQLERGNRQSALFLVGEGLKVVPEHPGLLDLRRGILQDMRVPQ